MKIVNIGSLNVDYVYRVNDFLQPGETKSCKSRNIYAGGKGLNQSVALAQAGATVYHAGCIGNDGDLLVDTLNKAGVRTDWLDRHNTAGGHTVIQVSDAGQNCILLYGGTNQELTEPYIQSVLAHCEPGDILLMQNETNLVDYAIRTAHAAGVRVALNASPVDDKLLGYPLELCSWLVVNEIEGSMLAGSSEDPDEIVAAMAKKYPHSALVLTLGSRGVVYHDAACTVARDAYHVDTVVDTTAAGDTFLGYFLACTAEGLSPAEALLRSTTASTLAIGAKGAAESIPPRDEVEKAIREHTFE